MKALDPERFGTVLEKIQDALPGPAQPVTEPVFETLYDILEAAAEAKDAAEGTLKDHPTTANSMQDPELKNQMHEQKDVEMGNTDKEPNAIESKPVSLVWKLRKEPEWLILISIALLGLMTMSLLTAIAVSPDCGCSNLHS